MHTNTYSIGARLLAPGGLGAKHIGLFPGAAINTDAAQVASSINRALDSLEAGKCAQAGSGAA
jgi:hypothetical protein